MQVVCIFSVTGVRNNIPDILRAVKEEINPGFTDLGYPPPEIKFPKETYVYVGVDKTIAGPPKGHGIIDSIKNCANVPDCVIACDGSNAIPYGYIIDIFKGIISEANMHCVMANRMEKKGIVAPRFLIERFEIHVIKECCGYELDIPDGQCGLWAYRYGKLHVNDIETEIKLTAVGYEIELDLLSEVLMKNLNFTFIDVELPERKTPSQFTYEQNLKKMEFILRKYDLMKLHMVVKGYIEKYEQGEEFKSLISSDGKCDEYWGKYKKDLLSVCDRKMKNKEA